MEVPFKRCPHNVEKGSEHEQVSKSIACAVALSISLGMGSEIPIPCSERSGREGGIQVCDGVLPATGM
jgi:hypothetical protein